MPDFVFVSALLEDNGDLPAKVEDINVLITAAIALAENAQGTDRITPLANAIAYSTAMLHLSNPAMWSPNAVSARIVTSTDYAGWTVSPPGRAGRQGQRAGSAFAFASPSDPAGSSYSLLFGVPVVTARTEVKVTISRVFAPDKLTQVGNFHGTIAIGDQNATRAFAAGADVSPAWQVERGMLPNTKVPIRVVIQNVNSAAQNSHATCDSSFGRSYCGPAPGVPGWNASSICGVTDYAQECDYTGPCAGTGGPVDVNPATGGDINNCALNFTLAFAMQIIKNTQLGCSRPTSFSGE